MFVASFTLLFEQIIAYLFMLMLFLFYTIFVLFKCVR